MSVKEAAVCVLRLVHVRRDLGGKQAGRQSSRLERAYLPQHFAAVVAGHSNRSDFRGALVHIEIRSVAHVNASVREVYRPFGVAGELREKLSADLDDRVRLSAGARNLARDENVLTIAKHS